MTAGATLRKLPLKMESQKMSEWCWSAVSVSINQFFRPESPHTQCEVAGAAFNVECCANNKGADIGQCNNPHELHPVLGRLHLLAADPILKPQTPLSFARVQREIDAGCPICVLIRWLDRNGQLSDRGHFIAISGYRVTPAQKQFISLDDPFYGPSEIDYKQFSSESGGYRDGSGVWYASFLVGNLAKH